MVKVYDVLVLGVGSAGLTVSLTAARLGFNVAVVEKHKIGGDCLNYGCVPSKTFIKSAKVMHQIKNAKNWGINAEAKKFDMKDLIKHRETQQDIIRAHEDKKYLEKLGIAVYKGSPRFLDSHQVQVGEQTLYAKYIVIATGASAFKPKYEGMHAAPYVTNEEIFSLDSLPKSLVVVGGGPIGCEMAQTFVRLGSKVAIIQGAETIMNREDPELAKILTKQFEKEGIRIIPNARFQKIEKRGRQKLVLYKEKIKDGQLGKEKGLVADQVLMSIGRKPNVQGMNLEGAGVNYSDKGILTDKRLRTNVKHIYAAGDVRGEYQFSHTAGYEGGVIISNMLFKFPKKIDYSFVPWATFTDPEFARVGLTQHEADEKKISYTVLRAEYKDLDRAITENEMTGMCKILVDKKGYIIGAHILGPHAGETIHEIILAMKSKLKIGVLAQMMHVYPTLAEIVRKAAGEYYKPKLYSQKTKKLLKFLNKWF